MDSNKQTLPLLLSPQQLLLAELSGTLSQWEHRQADCNTDPTDARDLLAHWAGLRRLAGDPLGDDRATRLDQLVRSAVAELAERMLPLGTDFAAGWRRQAEELSRSWDSARLEDHDDIAWSAQLLFEDLDRLQLAIWTLCELLPPESRMRPALEQFNAETTEAERFLIERPDLFIDRVEELGEVLSAARPNLEENCPALWATLLKHRRIEAEQESVAIRPARPQLLAAAARFIPPPAGGFVPGHTVSERRQHPVGFTPAQAGGFVPSTLCARFDELATPLGMAASPEMTGGSTAELKLAAESFSIDDDEEVHVELGLQSSSKLQVWLAGTVEEIQRYACVRLNLQDAATHLQAAFRRTVATLALSDDARDALRKGIVSRLELVDRAGHVHFVLLRTAQEKTASNRPAAQFFEAVGLFKRSFPAPSSASEPRSA